MLLCLMLLLPMQQPFTTTAPPPEFPPFEAKRFEAHIAVLADDKLAGRDVGTPGGKAAAEYVRDQLQKFGAEPLGPNGEWFQEFPFGMPSVTAINVLGVVRGAGKLASEAVIVSAHHDHMGVRRGEKVDPKSDVVFNGADDNASGCAAVLLLAEALYQDREKPEGDRRTVIFATFDAEEKGLVGSRHYTLKPWWPLERTTANINFDMVGRMKGDQVFAGDGNSSPFLGRRVAEIGKELGLRVETRGGGIRRADHVNFLDRQIPAMHILTGIHADYHQVSDETKKVNHEGGARISRLAYRLLRDAMTVPGPLKFRRTDLDIDLGAGVRLVQALGIFPAMNAQEGKYPLLQFVLPGSPAAKAGLKSGDEIVSINGKKFMRVEDAGIIFAELDLTKPMKLAILRKGEEKPIELPADAFAAFAGPKFEKLPDGKFKVKFAFKPAGKAKSVSVAGSFNAWKPDADPMSGTDSDGVWRLETTLPAGVHEYKFVVDGDKWLADPINMRRVGRFENSVLILGDALNE
jgi:hypothetical protein